jgi:hypothetical protein
MTATAARKNTIVPAITGSKPSLFSNVGFFSLCPLFPLNIIFFSVYACRHNLLKAKHE